MKPLTMRRAACGLAFAVAAGACQSQTLPQASMEPALGSLTRLSVIAVSDSFNPSGYAGTDSCDVVLVGAEWGTVVRIRNRPAVEIAFERIPGGREGSRLELFRGQLVLIWAQEPAFLGVLDVDRLAIDSIPLPRHSWGEHWVGPVRGLSEGWFALAPIGDPGFSRRSPTPWIPAPLIQVVDRDGRDVGSAGLITHRGGVYLSWLASRLAIGVVGDTILALHLSDAVLSAYAGPLADRVDFPLVWQGTLPLYFTAPMAEEEIKTTPWIQVGGDRVHLVDVPHVAMAAFGPEGRVFAVRNYGATWRTNRNRTFSAQGNWAITRQGLEIYDRRGRLLGAYALPESRIRGIRADNRGRIFLKGDGGRVMILQDPFAAGDGCPPLPARVPVLIADRPPEGAAVNPALATGQGTLSGM